MFSRIGSNCWTLWPHRGVKWLPYQRSSHIAAEKYQERRTTHRAPLTTYTKVWQVSAARESWERGIPLQNHLHKWPTRAHSSRTWTAFHALPVLCALPQVAMSVAWCTPAAVLILSWSVVVVVGVACCCCILFRLMLMLVLTFTPCACGGCHRQQHTVVVFLSQPLAQRLHLHLRLFHPLQLVPVVFCLLPIGADTGLTLGQLALCGG